VLSLIRVGQICGDTKTGWWSPDEMMPMLIASAPSLLALPLNFPNVSWIPSDICSTVLFEIVTQHNRPHAPDLQCIHVANPRIETWSKVASEIAVILGLDSMRLVPLAKYVELVKKTLPPPPIARLLGYLERALVDGSMPERYASLEVNTSLSFSASLAACPSISPEFLELLVRSIVGAHPATIPETESSFCFLFGPWSTMPATFPSQANEVLARVRQCAIDVLSECELPLDVPR
jgi:hypothetical protein